MCNKLFGVNMAFQAVVSSWYWIIYFSQTFFFHVFFFRERKVFPPLSLQGLSDSFFFLFIRRRDEWNKKRKGSKIGEDMQVKGFPFIIQTVFKVKRFQRWIEIAKEQLNHYLAHSKAAWKIMWVKGMSGFMTRHEWKSLLLKISYGEMMILTLFV
jgi:hypothetical protein